MSLPGKIDDHKAGVIYGTTAYLIWGVLPFYWRIMMQVPALEILAHRILWSFVFMGLIVILSGGWGRLVAVAANRKKLAMMFLCGIFVSINWGTYIYAVNTDQLIQSSMGYYINPLVTVLFGVTILREKLARPQLVAILLAAVGVLIITLQYGSIPWIAFTVAGSFALYGLTKKKARVDPVTGLALETLVVMPVALLYILSLESGGAGSIGSGSVLLIIALALSGVVTAIPLFLYARGVERTTLSMIGFLQYITPTVNLLLGIFVFGEYFSPLHFVSFCFIWSALLIFTLANLGVFKGKAPASEDTAIDSAAQSGQTK